MSKHPDADDLIAIAWLEHRRRLLDIAYRMLGTLSDADDAVQEAFLRLTRHGVDGIDDTLGWLITTTGRICLDKLRADTTRRRYIGPWLPEPYVDLPAATVDPADRVTLDESVQIAMLALLETLSPAERTVFVLHDVFAMSFDHVAEVVDRTPAACRQLASRARRHVAGRAEPRFDVEPASAQQVADRFAAACSSGDVAELLAVLDADVIGEFDSGGYIPNAPLVPLAGAPAVAATLAYAFGGAAPTFTVAPVNGRPGVVVALHGQVMAVISLDTNGQAVTAIRAIGNPNKLRHVNQA